MYLTVKQISDYLQIKPSTIYAWVAQRRIPFIKIHGLVRFRREEIDRWVETFLKEEPAFPIRLQKSGRQDIDTLIARAKREVYNVSRGETRPESAQSKEASNGAV